MSIINEALKKAVREKGASYSSEEKETVRRNIELEFQRKKPRLNWGPIFILLVLVLITGPIVAPIFSTPFKNVKYSGNTSNLTATHNIPSRSIDLADAAPAPDLKTNRKAQFTVEESPLFGNAPPTIISKTPGLSLSGVVYSDKDSYCIINNKVVKVGDTIQGAKLLEILQNSAKVDYQGKEITLTMNND